MRVHVRHRTLLEYSDPVVERVMKLRLGPFSDGHQRWDKHELRAVPGASVRPYVDGFGNVAHLTSIARRHDRVEIISDGELDTLLDDPFRPLDQPIGALSCRARGDFLGDSRLVPLSDRLARMASGVSARASEAPFDVSVELMQLVNDEIEYRQNVTDVTSTVDEVLNASAGVCQDLSHVLIGLLRSVGIAARYVSGYIVAATNGVDPHVARDPRSRRQPSLGGGASHAWVEAYSPTHGWRGFDPTNDLVAATYHVKMAIGRDYADVPPTRGTYRGFADEKLTVEVAAVALT
jgi:transglutaminase-like putative cysteine protease